MKRVLITGMSGTGKSSVILELRKRGYKAIDMDERGWSEHDEDGHQHWNEERLQKVFDLESDEILFISGCAENQIKFYPQLTGIILLSAPGEVLVERLSKRTNNPYGKRAEEIEEIFTYLETVEPQLRRGATDEIVTIIPLDQVVEKVLDFVT